MEDHKFAANLDTDTYGLVEERSVVMYPPSGGNPTLRNAHFLKPIFSEHENNLPSPPSLKVSSKPTLQGLKKYMLHSCKGYSAEKWKIWVHSLKSKYEEIWKQAGIYEAILASTYKIPRHKELIIGLAKRWCAETNTFVFPWGEVTITLEDVMFLGGFSVLGALFSTPLADEFVVIFKCLKNVLKKVKLSRRSIDTNWMNHFMGSGNELEHEAFLVMWLSRFVFAHSNNYICIKDFHVAIHLSRGNKIALAPVVLASIYRDMRVLHKSIVKPCKLELCHVDLVQMWAWERFSMLRPTPRVVERAEPRAARWNRVENLKVKDVGTALDSGEESFLWRPYVIGSSDCMLTKLYRDKEQWVVVESDDIESFARCLRVSKLVGLDYIEQYLPHRVAMQFGLDQDVPSHVIRSSENAETAWSTYNRSIRGMKLYIPPRLFESDVSSRYVVWRRGLLPVNEEMVTTCIQNEKHLPLISWGRKRRRANSLTTPGCLSARTDDYVEKGNLTIALTIAKPENRSIKTLSTRTKIDGKGIDLDNMPVLNTHSGTKSTPARPICMNETVKSRVQSMSSSDKCKERKSGTERPISPKEDAVVSSCNHAEVNTVRMELAKDEVLSKANGPESNIVNIEEESCDNTTSEITHLGLMARILRLEKTVEDIRAAKHDATILNSSSS
ncbi:PMD domain-containing protein [Heracleum sosnowskyi]|uniref:PMD domain-containing protein n=1 Tax=Heracleum sosnowskyi TaxID=360622 RepID=A0AAD8GVM9_9APIA|nr:PMD domain-containing protein [Heracleum sosnowskyi]